MIGCSMYILGVDSSTDILSVALCQDTRPLAEITFNADRAHAEKIIDTTDRVLSDAGVGLHTVDAFAVSRGPGSFTGIRIGVATMKGLALGAGKPLFGVSTLRAMAWLAGDDTRVACPLIDARIHEVYGAIFRRTKDGWIADVPECVGPIEQILAQAPDECVVFGDGAQRYADRLRVAAPHLRVLPADAGHPSGAHVAREALDAIRAGEAGDPAAVQPVYLRQSQPEEARRRAGEAAHA